MKNLKKNKGQGIVEYVGALVVAAVLVAGILALGPEGLGDIFTNILDAIEAYFMGQVPG